MEKIIHREEDRGKGEHGWLSTRYSFSFANWYDPRRMGFGTLRVLNDDWIAPGTGFPEHSHQNMEIITIITGGAVAHTDSMGNHGEVAAGEVQTMSAGTGVTHAEYNASQTEALSLFQIWITPKETGTVPRYAQAHIEEGDGLTLLVAPDGSPEGLPIGQDAYIFRGKISANELLGYALRDPAHGVYLFVIDGMVQIEEEELSRRDAMGITDTSHIEISSPTGAEILLIEIPMK